MPENLTILFDEKQLRQVLINLIRNAIRHNAPEAEYIEVNIHLNDGRIRIDVIDFGTGVAKEIFLSYSNHFLVPKLKELV